MMAMALRILLTLFILFYASRSANVSASGSKSCSKEGLVDLTLTVLGAHVKKSDIITGSDPYTRVSIGVKSMRTSSKSNTNTPIWNELIGFSCINATSALQVMVLDHDLIGADDLLLEAYWHDWAAGASPVTRKLYNKNKDMSSYWVEIRANFTLAPAMQMCMPTCMGLSCTEIDTQYGMLDGVCDKGGLELETNFGCDCDACDCSAPRACSATYTLSMNAETTKGWQGSFWEWRARNGALLDTGTLVEGAEGSTELCTFRNSFECYELFVNDLGDHPEECTWKIAETNEPGVVLSHGRALGFATLCTDDLCDATLLIIELHDRAGDGWNGNELQIYSCDGTSLIPGLSMAKGHYNNTFTQCVDTSSSGYFIVVTGGVSGDNQISWRVSRKDDGYVIAEGGALFAGGTCETNPSLDNGATSCNQPCLDSTCDAIDAMYGFYDGVCDYYGSNLEARASSCNCSSCMCLQGDEINECARSYTLSLSDTAGDGWGGSSWFWFSQDFVQIDSGTLLDSKEGTAVLCAASKYFDCYFLYVNDEGSWPSEISWILESEDDFYTSQDEGTSPGIVEVCTFDLCRGTILAVTMSDSYGDGWNGNAIEILSCSGQVLNKLTLGSSSGSYFEQLVCIEEPDFKVIVGGGSFPEEVSWSISTVTPGNSTAARKIMSGGAPYQDLGGCAALLDDDNKVVDPDSACPASCQGQTCEYWDKYYGTASGSCDYYGKVLEDKWSCDCSGCACSEASCASEESYTLVAHNGAPWEWTWAAGVEIATGTFVGGDYSSPLCRFGSKDKFACYTLNVREPQMLRNGALGRSTPASASDAASAALIGTSTVWKIVATDSKVLAEGGLPGSATVCDACALDDTLTITMNDSSGQGWGDTALSIFDCDRNEIISDASLLTGTSDTQWVCADTNGGRIDVVVEGDVSESISWSIQDKWGEELINGGAPFNYGTCTGESNDEPSKFPSLKPTAGPSLAPGQTQTPTLHRGNRPSSSPSVDFPSPEPTSDGTSNASAHTVPKKGIVLAALYLTAACGSAFALYWWWAKMGLKVPEMSHRDTDHATRLARYRNQGSELLWPRDDRSGSEDRDGADEPSVCEAPHEVPSEASARRAAQSRFNSMNTIVHSSPVNGHQDVYTSLGDDEL